MNESRQRGTTWDWQRKSRRRRPGIKETVEQAMLMVTKKYDEAVRSSL